MIPRQTLTWWTRVGWERRGVGEGTERLARTPTSKHAQKDQNPYRRGNSLNLCFLGCVRNQKMGGYSVCVDACRCAAYAWLRVLCMSCYAICVEARCVAAFPCRQQSSFPSISYVSPCTDSRWIYSITCRKGLIQSGMTSMHLNAITDIAKFIFLLSLTKNNSI